MSPSVYLSSQRVDNPMLYEVVTSLHLSPLSSLINTSSLL